MKKALFLDRDGVINVEKKYVYKIEDFEFMDGIFQLIRTSQEKNFLPIVITNQAGIARGYYTEEDFEALTRWMIEEFRKQGVFIAKVYFCPFHPKAGIGGYRMDSPDRKPRPGMLFRARDEFDLDLANSILIGDKQSDIEAGRNAGVGQLMLLDSDLDAPNNTEVSCLSNLFEIEKTIFSF